MSEILYLLLQEITKYGILFFELVSSIIMISVGFRGIYEFILRIDQFKLRLIHGMSIALEFKLVAVILRSLSVTTLEDIIFVLGILVLKLFFAILVRWELSHENKEISILTNSNDINDVFKEHKDKLVDQIDDIKKDIFN